MTPNAPTVLSTNGRKRPLGVGRVPLLRWRSQLGQRYMHVVVEDDRATVWDSHPTPSTVAEVRPPIELRSRTVYRWRVRIADVDGSWSGWSEVAEWETPLLSPEDWEGSWISRSVPPAVRTIRAIEGRAIDWADPDEVLEQEFFSSGPVEAVSFDLTGELNADVDFDLELIDDVDRIVGRLTVQGPQHLWDRFLHFIDVTPSAPAGRYRARMLIRQGRVGWRRGERLVDVTDDGVSPLPIIGQASRSGVPVDGTRLLGVDTTPAENPVFRHGFVLTSPTVRARLHVVAVGNGRFVVNDRTVGDAIFDPAPTDFSRTIHYRSWDVTHLLQRGNNEIVVHAGRGNYAARGASVWGWHLADWHAEPRALVQLEWIDEVGQRHVVSSGPDWQTAPSGTTERLYVGETSVTRATEPAWEPVSVVGSPDLRLKPAPLPPMREIRAVPPQSCAEPEPGLHIADFGLTIAGRVRLRVEGGAGSWFSVRSGEALDENGRVSVDNFLTAGPTQLDVHRFEVGGEIDWTQEFGYRGFRWVEIETHGDIHVHDVSARQVHTDVELVGEFDTDDPVLRWWSGALRRTFLNNLHGIPTDTPIFEKNGWTADAHLAVDAVLQQIDLRDTFGKWINDHADSQDSFGVVPQIVPSPGWGREADPAWSGSAVLIPWSLYWEYGELGILERAEPMIRRYADALLDIAEGRLWPLRSWGDWLAPGYDIPPEGATPAATMMMASVLQHAERVVRELGDDAAATVYGAAARELGRVYDESYFDPSAGSYGVPGVGYRQTMNVLPLAFGLVPLEHVERVRTGLVGDLEARTRGHLDVGALGARHLLDVLDDAGREDLALSVALNRTRPGWGAWYEEGEATLMEAWTADARSHNHYFLGSALSWVHHRIGAARAAMPGWEVFDIDPIIDGRVRRGHLRHRTVRGELEVQWSRSAERLLAEVAVPTGSRGIITLTGQTFEEGRHSIAIETQNSATKTGTTVREVRSPRLIGNQGVTR